MQNTAQAKKFFYDWLDNTRPWSKPNVNCYEMMEEMVLKAAQFFNGEKHISHKQYADLQKNTLAITSKLREHPDGYDGPCICPECLENE